MQPNTKQKPELSFVGISDMAGKVRGKSFPTDQWEKRADRGVGWTPAIAYMTCFDTIAASDYGAFGDLLIVPDPDTRFPLPCLRDGMTPSDFMLGDILTLDGAVWDLCLRGKAKAALAKLYDNHGIQVRAAFEHEFINTSIPPHYGDGYGFRGFRASADWSGDLMAALRAAGITPDTFMKEYGPSQYELTIAPEIGLKAADFAVLVRELTRDVLRQHDAEASFTPIIDPAKVGTGVHIHMSFLDKDMQPITYDASHPQGLSDVTKYFIGGVLKYLKPILAFLSSSEISYLRLTPHRWSAAYNNLGYRDREAAVRICPITALDADAIAKQFNIEMRAVDASSSPHLALAAIIFAGEEGIRNKISPSAPTDEDIARLPTAELAKRGIEPLPKSLTEALDEMAKSKVVRGWFGDDFVDAFITHKKSEIDFLKDMTWQEKCTAYTDAY